MIEGSPKEFRYVANKICASNVVPRRSHHFEEQDKIDQMLLGAKPTLLEVKP
jgi:hypothetical protein